MTLPDFSVDDRRKLSRLGVCPEQIEELRFALIWVRLVLRPPAGKNATKAHLTEIRDAATALHKKLGVLYRMPGADYQHAAELLDALRIVDDADDPTASISDLVLPRLTMLLEATAYGLRELAEQGPARHRTGDPRPVARIETALVKGWVTAHGPIAERITARTKGTGDLARDEAAMEEEVTRQIAQTSRTRPAKPYPKKLQPSSQEFKEVVRVVYAAAGYGEPKRAIEKFVALWNASRAGAAAAMQKAIAEGRIQ